MVPSIEYKKYREFYYSFKSFVEQHGYYTELFISNDNPQTELALIQRAQAVMAVGLATVTCIKDAETAYREKGFEKVYFIERKPNFDAGYYGFDFVRAGESLAKIMFEKNRKKVILITDSLRYSNEKEFYSGFQAEFDRRKQSVKHLTTNIQRVSLAVLNLLVSREEFDTIVTSNVNFAEEVKNTIEVFFDKKEVPIYTLSPVVSLPERKFHKYELNYSLLGREAAMDMIHKSGEPIHKVTILENDGVRNWTNIEMSDKPARRINVLTLESPEANIMEGLAKLYTEKTGTEVKVSIFSYDEIYEQFLYSEKSDLYDVLRIDVTWLSWFAERLLTPLEEINPQIKEVFKEYIPSLEKKYSFINGKAYALPVTPSAQLLFYRKDLFEDTANKRCFQEKYKKELKVPETFEEYNQIAEFFFEMANKGEVDVKYGTSLTMGNTGVAATEFLARLFGHKKRLYNEKGKIVIYDDAGLMAMQELIETRKYTSPQTSRWWTSTAQEFADGDLAMMINFSNYASEILGRKLKIVENVGLSMVPGGNPIYGGGTLGISKNSNNKEDALSFIRWITKEPVASAMAMLGSVSPCLKTYSKYDIIEAFPWLELSKECFAHSTTNRMPENNANPFDEKRFVNIIGTAVRNVVTGIQSMEESLMQAQKLIDREMNSLL